VTDLVEWLTAQLDHDEQWARAASAPYRHADAGLKPPPDGVHWRWVTGDQWEPAIVDPVVSELVADGDPVWLATAETWQVSYAGTDHVRQAEATHGQAIEEMSATWAGHIALHDPARVLRQVVAHRAILARHKPVPGEEHIVCDIDSFVGHDDTEGLYGDPYPCADVRALASIYSDRPGYDPSWTVE
jgi:hypothetical protein